MRVLITGGGGFIGSHLVENFQGRAEIVVLDNFRTGRRENLKGMECELFEGSILDRELVRQAMQGVDYVFHLAAMVSVPESMSNPVECNRVNGEGTLVVLEEAAAAKVKKLCFSTSAAVYGDSPEMPKREEMTPDPKSPYAVTKLDGEYYCAMFAREGRLPTACLRYFNVFGPRQDPKSAYAAAVPIFIAQATAGKPLTIHGDGEQTRDFVFVKDVVAANEFMAVGGHTGVFNVAYGKSISINELAKLILAATKSKSPLVHGPERPGDVKHSLAAIDRLRAAGFRPRGSFAEGLATTIAARGGNSKS